MNNGGGYERIRASLLRQSEGSEGGGRVMAGVHTTLMFSNREGRCVCVWWLVPSAVSPVVSGARGDVPWRVRSVNGLIGTEAR